MFDYVVVGAGSAGCVVARRLAERAGISVAVLEAGRRDPTGISRIPAAVHRTIGNPRYDWRFATEPDPSRDNRRETWPRGRMLGGTSAINGMIFVRGCAADFDRWAEQGNPGWAWSDVLPLFRRLETSDRHDNASRGNVGPQRVSDLRYVHPLTEPFIEAAMGLGLPRREDVNGAGHEGVGKCQGSIDRGLRHSAYDAFLKPLRAQSNLEVIEDFHAAQVVFDGRRAIGVRGRQDGRCITVGARHGVVLAAGTLNTPQMLMLSGIGPATNFAGTV